MHPIAAAFHISMLEVTFVITITLWMRLIGATASGWICDRIGRKPLTIAILGYPVCNFAAGLSPLWGIGYAIPMMVGTMVFASSYVAALLLGPETKGKELVADLLTA
jgi:SHS family lactate transporter-like MFS transporter